MSIETLRGGNAAVGREGDPRAVGSELVQEATARLFRSVRVGRSWVRAQASRLAAPHNDAGHSGACVALKPGNDDPPIFMIPGAPGSTFQLAPLATALAVPMPVYAIKPRGLEDGETPCPSIAEMAQHSIAAIKAVRPSGPYLLIGYSAGGLVALETAQQLAAAGDEVPLVIFLDTYPSRKIWPLGCHFKILARQTARAIGALRRQALSPGIGDAKRRLRSLVEYLAASGVKMLPPPALVPEGVSAASRRVHEATFNAGEAYRPTHYSGKVVFVQPEEVPDLEPQDPALVWRKLLDDFAVCRVPGSHLGMLEAGAATTAAVLGECLEQAGLSRPATPRAVA